MHTKDGIVLGGNIVRRAFELRSVVFELCIYIPLALLKAHRRLWYFSGCLCFPQIRRGRPKAQASLSRSRILPPSLLLALFASRLAPVDGNPSVSALMQGVERGMVVQSVRGDAKEQHSSLVYTETDCST